MISKNSNKIIIVLGPTSSGKSSLAVKLAKEFNGEIISVDSRQVYREMDLGTGKVPGLWKNEVYYYEEIPHYLIDFVSPEDDYNVSHFKRDCEKKILEIFENKKVPILCGGTGFWIQAVVDDVALPQTKPNHELRKDLEKKTTEELLEMLKEKDQKRAAQIDPKNRYRLIRSIEIVENLGKVPEINIDYSSSKRLINNKEVEFLQIGIPIDKEKLENKINRRLGERFEDGMLEEIQNLFKKYSLSKEKISNFGIAYSLIDSYNKKEITKAELFEKIVQAEKNYAKRQMTWFKKDPRIFWIDNYDKIKNRIKKFLKE